MVFMICSRKILVMNWGLRLRRMADDGNVEATSWMPAFAGMTGGGPRAKSIGARYYLIITETRFAAAS
jgi:hypothetical protein